MNIEGIAYELIDIYDLSITVPDSFVVNENKTCSGHGEAKLYMGSKEHMRKFYTGSTDNAGFTAECVILKKDLQQYMQTMYHEYHHPSIKYRGQGKKKNMGHLWEQRKNEIAALPDTIRFTIKDQNQIDGPRGYVKSTENALRGGYGVIRKISLPFVSYVSVMKLQDEENGNYIFYWKLFTDFTQMAEQQYAAKNYGKKKRSIAKHARDGQISYRQNLFAQFCHCPFSKIDDLRLLIASHIKPWAVCEKSEKTDTNNGLMLSPLFDKLFDKGYISFEDNGKLKISDWLSSANRARIDFTYDVEDLHLNAQRKEYLAYHREFVFK